MSPRFARLAIVLAPLAFFLPQRPVAAQAARPLRPVAAGGSEPGQILQRSDEELLREAEIGQGDADLTAFLRGLGEEQDVRDVPRLIRLLASEQFAEREEAHAKLLAKGNAALPLLRNATTDKDAEIAGRTKR